MSTTIDVRCERCGMVTGVSEESLRGHGGDVVCPRCLHHTVVAGYEPVAAEPTVPAATPEVFHYCFHCGKPLPVADAIYCPYCGNALHADASPVSRQAAVTEPAAEQPVATTTPPAQAIPAAEPLPRLAFLPSNFAHTWLNEPQQQRASVRFLIAAGTVIIGLLVLLVIILRAIAALP